MNSEKITIFRGALKRVINADGHEEMFAVNYLSHFLLTNLLMESIKTSGSARIVNVASDAHWFACGINYADLTFEAGFKPLRVYGHSKLANILFTIELARRFPADNIIANAVDPGGFGARTALGRQNGWKGTLIMNLLKPFLQPAEKGAQASIYTCSSRDLDCVSGKYFKGSTEKRPKEWATDQKRSKILWEITESLLQGDRGNSLF